MPVVVDDDNMSIDQALSMLWRESNRENIPEVIQEQRYRIPDRWYEHQKRREYKKRKRRRRAAKRRENN
jgi:ribosomal protein S21